MQIKNKFKTGDKIYVIEKRVAKKECPECGGVSEVKVCNTRYICPCCGGKGEITDYDNILWYVLDETKEIRAILVEIIGKDVDIEYETQSVSYPSYKEQNCFKTKEEAQAECKRRNEEE